jgi:hypothetical protein
MAREVGALRGQLAASEEIPADQESLKVSER